MSDARHSFLKTGMFTQLESLQDLPPALWGKMNLVQALDHIADFFDVSSGKINYGLVTPEEYLPKYKEFLFSDKQFRENTKAPGNIIGDEPSPARSADLRQAVSDLRRSVEDFFDFFDGHPGTKTVHPAFGPLDFEEWIILHHKHVTHHFRQFGLMPRII